MNWFVLFAKKKQVKVKQQVNDFIQISLKAYGFNNLCIKLRCCLIY